MRLIFVLNYEYDEKTTKQFLQVNVVFGKFRVTPPSSWYLNVFIELFVIWKSKTVHSNLE